MDDQRTTDMGSRALNTAVIPGKIDFEFVYGGTFDPVHLGHLGVLDALTLLAPRLPIRVLPCAIPALKSLPQSSFNQRVDMLKLVIAPYVQVFIDPRENQGKRTSYTFDTLQLLSLELPSRGFIFVVGADSLINIQQWYRWQEISKLCHLLVLNRPGYSENSVENLLTGAGFLPAAELDEVMEFKSGRGFALTMQEKPQSSTEIRHAAINNDCVDSMLTQSVIEYIRNHHLYERK